MYACHKNQDRLVEILLKKGADPQDFDKVKCIHAVCRSTFVVQTIWTLLYVTGWIHACTCELTDSLCKNDENMAIVYMCIQKPYKSHTKAFWTCEHICSKPFYLSYTSVALPNDFLKCIARHAISDLFIILSCSSSCSFLEITVRQHSHNWLCNHHSFHPEPHHYSNYWNLYAFVELGGHYKKLVPGSAPHVYIIFCFLLFDTTFSTWELVL